MFQAGNDVKTGYERMKAKVNDELKQHFRPEFLNRVDDTIIFRPLATEDIARIVDLQIGRLVYKSRAGMGDLVTELRGLTATGYEDYKVAGIYYWSDKHLQDALDRHRTDFYDESLYAVQQTRNGTTYYLGNDFNTSTGFTVARTTGGVRKVVKVFEYCKPTDPACAPRGKPKAEDAKK